MGRTTPPGKSQGRLCGANVTNVKEDGHTTCRLPAGYGTDHLGWGKCKWHMGSTPALKIHAAKQEAEHLIKVLRAGMPIEIHPDQALLQEVHRTAGVVAWLETAIGDQFDQVNDVVTLTEQGWRPRAFHDIWLREREHLAKVAKMAIDAGIAERQVRLAEEQGQLLATVIRNILGDLALTPEQRAEAPQIVRRHLLALESG